MSENNDPAGADGRASDSEVTVYWQPDSGSATPGALNTKTPGGPRLRRSVVILAVMGVVSLVALAGLSIVAVTALNAARQTSSVRSGGDAKPPSSPPSPAAQLRVTPTPPASSSTQPAPRLRKPAAAAKACPDIYTLRSGPSYSAVNEKATCPFAENVRRAYVQNGVFGVKVPLHGVFSPVTRKIYDMTCRGRALVTCRGGIDAVVFLYG